MSGKKDKIFLIDGTSFCYRAFYAIRELSNSKGMPTNAIFGVINMLRKLFKEHDPGFIAVVFDLKGPTVRHAKYEEYKIQRKPMPDELIAQIPRIKEVIKAYRIPVYEMKGQEADDIIATLAVKAEKKGRDVVIVTSDKDALQLVDDRIKVLSPHAKDGKTYGRKEVREKYGVDPSSMIELMALMGDSSDNVPGVKGIGQVSARKLIEKYGKVENVYKNIDDISSSSLREKLEKDKEMAMLSKELVTLDTDLPVKLDLKKMERSEPDDNALTELYREFEFRALLQEVMPKDDAQKGTLDYICSDPGDAGSVLKNISDAEMIAISVDVDQGSGRIDGLAVSFREKQAFYFPVKGSRSSLPDEMLDILTDDNLIKLGYDIKNVLKAFVPYGINIADPAFDVMLADYLIDPSSPGHDLSSIAFRHLGYGLKSEKTGLNWDDAGQGTLDLSGVKEYRPVCEEADVVFRLYGQLMKDLKKKKLLKLFNELEMPLIPVLASMERTGIKIDTAYVEKMARAMDKKIGLITKKIYRLAGEEFNVNSPKQLQYILFEKLGMPAGKKTKTGVSTDESVLTRLAKKHELPAVLLEYRSLSKLKSTYYDAILRLVDKDTKKLHTHFNQAVTATGRLSSSEPNLQNIPVRDPVGREIRKAFVPETGSRVLISADYSQVELRILAHLSGDKNLIKAFNDKEDIHRYTASLIFDTPLEDITSDMRAVAKTVNFGVTYGMGAFRLAKDLGISMEEARAFIDSYFSRYSGIKKFMNATLEQARKKGYVTTILGRRRDIPQINSSNVHEKGFAERTAINTPLQGSSADLIKLAMIACSREVAFEGSGVDMLLQVHDELIFTAPKEDAEKTALKIKESMEGVMELKVPIIVDIKAGPDWMDLKELDLA